MNRAVKKSGKALAALLLALLLLAGCQGPQASQVSQASQASQASQTSQTSQEGGSSVAEDPSSAKPPKVSVPEKVKVFNKQSDLPQDCNTLEVYAFKCDAGAENGYFLCLAMNSDGETHTYLSEELYAFRFVQLPSVRMYNRQLAGYDSLSTFQSGGELASYYDSEVRETGGKFWPVQMSFEFENENEVGSLQEAFFQPSDIDITTGEPR